MQSTYFRFGKDGDSQLYALVDDEVGQVGAEVETQAAQLVADVAPLIPPLTQFDAMLYADGSVVVTRMVDPSTKKIATDEETEAMALHLGVGFMEGYRGDNAESSD